MWIHPRSLTMSNRALLTMAIDSNRHRQEGDPQPMFLWVGRGHNSTKGPPGSLKGSVFHSDFSNRSVER
jgi:hypothetical protein